MLGGILFTFTLIQIIQNSSSYRPRLNSLAEMALELQGGIKQVILQYCILFNPIFSFHPSMQINGLEIKLVSQNSQKLQHFGKITRMFPQIWSHSKIFVLSTSILTVKVFAINLIETFSYQFLFSYHKFNEFQTLMIIFLVQGYVRQVCFYSW